MYISSVYLSGNPRMTNYTIPSRIVWIKRVFHDVFYILMVIRLLFLLMTIPNVIMKNRLRGWNDEQDTFSWTSELEKQCVGMPILYRWESYYMQIRKWKINCLLPCHGSCEITRRNWKPIQCWLNIDAESSSFLSCLNGQMDTACVNIIQYCIIDKFSTNHHDTKSSTIKNA